MKPQIVTTNIRLPKSDLLQYRAIAAEMDLSFNELVKKLLAQLETLESEAIKQRIKQSYAQDSFWKLADLSEPFKETAEVEWNEDDKIIYDL